MAADSTVLKNVLTRTATEAKDEVKRLGGVYRIAKSLNSSVENGLDRNQVASNRQKYGENVVPTRPPSTFLELAFPGCYIFHFAGKICILCSLETDYKSIKT